MTCVIGRAHDILLVTLIALRPLIWSGDAGAWDNLAWLLLVLIALGWLVIDAWRGRIAQWRVGLSGMLAAMLLLIVLPAALHSPYPSTGIGVWGMAMLHLGFAAYLMQVMPGRERLAFGALLGGLTVECLIALGQWAWVLPGMTAALTGGDPDITAWENANGDLANRVAYGGLFGTFTLANTLAAFLLLTVVPLLGVTLRAQTQTRLIAGGLLLLAMVVALGTASKGAAVALFIAAAVVWMFHRTDHWRWFAPAAVMVTIVLIAVVPQLRALGESSAHVRLGYWESAINLIGERPLLGHGLHGFSAHSTRTMPLDGEPTRQVHNEVLQATVDGGILAGFALALWLLILARRRPTVAVAGANDSVSCSASSAARAAAMWAAAWPLVLILPLFTALGMLASNLEWWPLGADEATWWLWPLLFAGVVIAIALLSQRLPLPPAWAWQLALAAFALHCLVDFNLQSPGIWGTLIVVSVLAGGKTFSVGARHLSRTVVSLLVLGLGIGLVLGIARSSALAQATALVNQVQLAEPDIRERFVTLAPTLQAVATRWPMDAALMLTIVQATPASSERLQLSESLAKRQPWSAQALEMLASDHARSGAWIEALRAMRQAVANNPAYLPRRQRLVDVLVRAARALPSQAAELIGEAERESQRIAELAQIVHPRNRLPQVTESTLPVEPAP